MSKLIVKVTTKSEFESKTGITMSPLNSTNVITNKLYIATIFNFARKEAGYNANHDGYLGVIDSDDLYKTVNEIEAVVEYDEFYAGVDNGIINYMSNPAHDFNTVKRLTDVDEAVFTHDLRRAREDVMHHIAKYLKNTLSIFK